MYKHIVRWKLKPFSLGKTAPENAKELKRLLENLMGVIESIKDLRVTLEPGDGWHVELDSTFANEEALAAYQVHPAHQAVAGFVREISQERQVEDFWAS